MKPFFRLLLTAAVALPLSQSCRFESRVTGHRWTSLAARNSGDVEDEASLGSPIAGNVRVVSLVQTELVETEPERVTRSLCHVFLELPSEVDAYVSGGGIKRGELHRNIKLRQTGSDREHEIELRFQRQQKRLSIHGTIWVKMDGKPVVFENESYGHFKTDSGNILFVQFDPVTMKPVVKQIDEIITGPMELAQAEEIAKELATK